MILSTFLSENPLGLVWRLVLSVMVQGGEVFGELDTVSCRLLLQLVRYVADILLVLGMFRTITQPPSALVRNTRIWLLSSLGTLKHPMVVSHPNDSFQAQFVGNGATLYSGASQGGHNSNKVKRNLIY